MQTTVNQKEKALKRVNERATGLEQQLSDMKALKESAERERNSAKHTGAQTKVCRMLICACLSYIFRY